MRACAGGKVCGATRKAGATVGGGCNILCVIFSELLLPPSRPTAASERAHTHARRGCRPRHALTVPCVFVCAHCTSLCTFFLAAWRQ
ncbi:hypothetical protein EON67_10045 [archaeon]|nr:MAG: hypothetical protein EON67_10045 [archaeon]